MYHHPSPTSFLRRPFPPTPPSPPLLLRSSSLSSSSISVPILASSSSYFVVVWCATWIDFFFFSSVSTFICFDFVRFGRLWLSRRSALYLRLPLPVASFFFPFLLLLLLLLLRLPDFFSSFEFMLRSSLDGALISCRSKPVARRDCEEECARVRS